MLRAPRAQMTMEPGAKRIVIGSPGESLDTDSDESEVGSPVVEEEPGFGHFLMNFPYEEPLEDHRRQTNRRTNFPYGEG